MLIRFARRLRWYLAVAGLVGTAVGVVAVLAGPLAAAAVGGLGSIAGPIGGSLQKRTVIVDPA